MNIPVDGVNGGRPSNVELKAEKSRIRRVMIDCCKHELMECEHVIAAGAAPLSWYLIRKEEIGERLVEMPDAVLWNKVKNFVCGPPGRDIASFGRFIGSFVGRAIGKDYFIEEFQQYHQSRHYLVANDVPAVKAVVKIYGIHSPLEFIQCPGGVDRIDDVMDRFDLNVCKVAFEFRNNVGSTLFDDEIATGLTSIDASVWATARKTVVNNTEKRKLRSTLRRMSVYESYGFDINNADIARGVIQESLDRADRVEQEGEGVLNIPEVSDDEMEM
ncbi:hypothetical protein SEMRO_455_G146600.1 [Seminavis robusta]|uniref:Uncharacterized protein n=1 Tax=Seminavis robusta TaxID=568900 RepID=A0A9N8DY29_9STRA|nr:hypothetical protein SEMRO_455_G146600.1 [Seminavis robusta]|eukprot:Sro455_g146600.1 n/a (273) ;mRNA; f:62573-63391